MFCRCCRARPGHLAGHDWSVPGSDAVHLTFDDGPDPGHPGVDILAQHGAKQPFVVGDQAARHSDILGSEGGGPRRREAHHASRAGLAHPPPHTCSRPWIHGWTAAVVPPSLRENDPAQARCIAAHEDLIMWDVAEICPGGGHAEVASAKPGSDGAPSRAAWSCSIAPSTRQGSALLPDYLAWLSQNGSR